jgi:hypothetical protein
MKTHHERRVERSGLQVAAAASAVEVWERCSQYIPDGPATLERARKALALAQKRYAEVLAENPYTRGRAA